MLLCVFHASLAHAGCLRIDGSHPAHVQLKLCQRTRKCPGRMCALPCWDGYYCMVVHMKGYTIILYHHPGLIDCKQVMEEELGRPVRDAFAELSSEPVAAASLGQVRQQLSTRARTSTRIHTYVYALLPACTLEFKMTVPALRYNEGCLLARATLPHVHHKRSRSAILQLASRLMCDRDVLNSSC